MSLLERILDISQSPLVGSICIKKSIMSLFTDLSRFLFFKTFFLR